MAKDGVDASDAASHAVVSPVPVADPEIAAWTSAALEGGDLKSRSGSENLALLDTSSADPEVKRGWGDGSVNDEYYL